MKRILAALLILITILSVACGNSAMKAAETSVTTINKEIKEPMIKGEPKSPTTTIFKHKRIHLLNKDFSEVFVDLEPESKIIADKISSELQKDYESEIEHKEEYESDFKYIFLSFKDKENHCEVHGQITGNNTDVHYLSFSYDVVETPYEVKEAYTDIVKAVLSAYANSYDKRPRAYLEKFEIGWDKAGSVENVNFSIPISTSSSETLSAENTFSFTAKYEDGKLKYHFEDLFK